MLLPMDFRRESLPENLECGLVDKSIDEALYEPTRYSIKLSEQSVQSLRKTI